MKTAPSSPTPRQSSGPTPNSSLETAFRLSLDPGNGQRGHRPMSCYRFAQVQEVLPYRGIIDFGNLTLEIRQAVRSVRGAECPPELLQSCSRFVIAG